MQTCELVRSKPGRQEFFRLPKISAAQKHNRHIRARDNQANQDPEPQAIRSVGTEKPLERFSSRLAGGRATQ